jgi:glycosyltransferase involved in cell wall biosynthesis
MATPEIVVLVSSYERPQHLRRVLHSLDCQVGVEGRFEVVVTDDGSTDETLEVVRKFAQRVAFPVGLTTHPHEDYRLAQCRNEGVRASTAPYLLFLDGDCLIPPDHLWQHLARRSPGVVHAGFCVELDELTSEKIDIAAVRTGAFQEFAPHCELQRLTRLDRKSRFYNLLRHPSKPKLFGGNVGIYRTDYEAVNGYDENFVGWGGEDDDLRLRLRQSGRQIRSILRWTRTYHLWHPPGPTTPRRWREGANIAYLQRPGSRPTKCVRGLCNMDADADSRAA